jgi:hypothetical protein
MAAFGILGILTGLVALVCWILVLIKMFSSEVIQGVFGLICGLWAFIWGWIHADEQGLKTVMLVWTVCAILGVVFNVGATALGLGGGLSAVTPR